MATGSRRMGWIMRTAFSAVLAMAPGMVLAQGGIFVTGHDPDFHAFVGSNTTGAQHIIQDALAYVTKKPSINVGSILLVTDLKDPGAGYSDPRLGLTAAGYTFTVADDGSAGGGVLNLNTVNFSNYNAIVIASDFGGWLRQSELNILDSRTNDLIKYINGGGGLVAFAEQGGGPGLTTSGDFGYLPFLVTQQAKNQSEIGNTVTPFGATLGLTNGDVNGNASHNIFTNTGGMHVVDNDASGAILSLAFYGNISTSGTVPELGGSIGLGMLLLGGGLLGLRRRR